MKPKTEKSVKQSQERAASHGPNAITVTPGQLRDNLLETLNRLTATGATVTGRWLQGQEKTGRVMWPADVTRNGVTFTPDVR